MAGKVRVRQSHKALMGLRSLVLGGEVAPGERLAETVLSERLGISRTPLREAIGQLVEEGLLERMPAGGCRVAELGIADVVDAIEMRGAVEATGLRLAAERGAEPAALARCHALLRRIEAALGASADSVDFPLYAALNEEFHAEMMQLAGSRVLAREHARVVSLPLARPSAFLKAQATVPAIRQSLFAAQHQHRAMIEAVTAREGTRAAALAQEHARLARTNLDLVLAAPGPLRQQVPGLSLVRTKTGTG